MTTFFLDSSALAKRYLPEAGTRWLRQQFIDTNTFLVSRIASVEVMSAVSRRHREGKIELNVVDGINRLLHKHFQQQYVIVDVNSNVTHDAIQLIRNHPLRAYDAIQLATAKFVNNRLLTNQLSPITFLCSDTRLLQIAEVEGVPTDDPNNHP